MVRIIIERHFKSSEGILPLLNQIRREAIKQPGYISGETMVNAKDSSRLIIISNWDNLKDWEAWHASKKRVEMCEKIKPILVEPAKETAYRYLSYRRNT